MTLLDRVIAWLSPARGFERLAAREALRSFDALTIDRLRARPNPLSMGPRQETEAGREKLLQTARDLDRNNGWAHGVFQALTDNIVGDGIMPEVQIRGPRGGLKTELNDFVEREWAEWAKACDRDRQTSFYDLEALVERELWVAGEVLVQHTVRDGRLVLELIQSERLANKTEEKTAGGGKILQGIEYDAQQRIVAYWIYPDDPADGGAANAPIRVKASEILHLYHPDRIGRIRGLTRIHPVANTFSALAQYLDYELTRARIVASWALLLKRQNRKMTVPVVEGASTTDESGNPLLHVHGGMIFQGGPSDSLESAGPSIQTTAFEPFVVLMLRMVAVGLNVSYELLTRDFSRTNFSSSRSSALEDRRHWRPRQKFLMRRLCEPIHQQFLGVLRIQHATKFAAIDPRQIPVFWRAPGWDWVDPMKEVQAEELAVRNGFKAPQDVCAEHGRDFYAVVDQLAEAQKYAEEREVKLGFFQQGEPKQEQEQEDNGSEDTDEAAEGRAERPRIEAAPRAVV